MPVINLSTSQDDEAAFSAVSADESGPLIIRTPFDPPKAEAGIVVRLLRAGICSSDIKELRGQRPIRTNFAHELVGDVVKTFGQADFLAGQRIVFNPNIPVQRTTGFAPYLLGWGKREDLLQAFFSIPTMTDPDVAVFCEPVAVSLHTLDRLCENVLSSALTDLRIVILGAGFMGTLLASTGLALGAHVTLANRTPTRLDDLRNRSIFPARRLRLISEIGSKQFDAAIVATSEIDAPDLTAAIDALVDGGILQLFGGTTKRGQYLVGINEDLDEIRRSESKRIVAISGKMVLVSGGYGANSLDMARAITLLSSGRLQTHRLVTHRTSLHQLPALLRQLITTARFGKTLVDLEESEGAV